MAVSLWGSVYWIPVGMSGLRFLTPWPVFGRNRSFGTGGFNLKLHRRFSESFSAAIGWNGFLTLGDDTSDFEDSVYGSVHQDFQHP